MPVDPATKALNALRSNISLDDLQDDRFDDAARESVRRLVERSETEETHGSRYRGDRARPTRTRGVGRDAARPVTAPVATSMTTSA
jgi:hypothetical protein